MPGVWGDTCLGPGVWGLGSGVLGDACLGSETLTHPEEQKECINLKFLGKVGK